MTSVYGRQPYHPQRITSKASYLHYQSPVNPKTAAIVAGLLKGDRGTASKPASQDISKPVLQDMKSVPETEVVETRKKRKDAPKASPSPRGAAFKHRDNAQYYFHPRVDLPYFAPEEGGVAAPMEGQLVPMAIPLGKPKTNPALRPPIPTQEGKRNSLIEGRAYVPYITTFLNTLRQFDFVIFLILSCLSANSRVITSSPTPDSAKSSDKPQSQSPVPSPVKLNKSARPNVAVITVYDKELGDETTHQFQRHKKSSAKNKKNALAVQVINIMVPSDLASENNHLVWSFISFVGNWFQETLFSRFLVFVVVIVDVVVVTLQSSFRHASFSSSSSSSVLLNHRFCRLWTSIAFQKLHRLLKVYLSSV